MPASPPDHYATLGLDRSCTRANIDTAYRLLAKRHHPDVNPGSAEAAERTRHLNDAHENLSDPARRRVYDRELDDAQRSQRAPRGRRLERDIAQDLHLRLEDFFRGATLEVDVRDAGNIGGAETYRVVVPANSAPGARLRVPRESNAEGGFLILRLRLQPSHRFKARGSDLKCDLRISNRAAEHGGTEMLRGPTGTMLRVTIPPRIRRGETLRLPGEGSPRPRGGRGDLLVRVTYRPEVRVRRG
ncbi:MAG: DnaJ domain-containing protein [Verrucomicrobiota bacterium]|nr:DnaJ domain-containing protein [Verrucomicrobiota bacterium]